MSVQEVGDEPNNPPFVALRLEDRVYIEYPRTGERELYDLRDDPHQLNNLAASTDQAELDRLSTWLARLSACGADTAVTCTTAEEPPPAPENTAAPPTEAPQSPQPR